MYDYEKSIMFIIQNTISRNIWTDGCMNDEHIHCIICPHYISCTMALIASNMYLSGQM